MADGVSVNPSDEISLPEQQMQSRGPRWVFFGSDGLRAGWGALLFFVIVVSLGEILTFIIRTLLHGHRPERSCCATEDSDRGERVDADRARGHLDHVAHRRPSPRRLWLCGPRQIGA